MTVDFINEASNLSNKINSDELTRSGASEDNTRAALTSWGPLYDCVSSTPDLCSGLALPVVTTPGLDSKHLLRMFELPHLTKRIDSNPRNVVLYPDCDVLRMMLASESDSVKRYRIWEIKVLEEKKERRLDQDCEVLKDATAVWGMFETNLLDKLARAAKRRNLDDITQVMSVLNWSISSGLNAIPVVHMVKQRMRVQRLSQDNQIKQRRAWLLLGWVTAERSCPCKQPACPAIGGGSEVTFKPLVLMLSIREDFLALTLPALDGCPDGHMQLSELGRPFTGGSWCGAAAGHAVYYSETATVTLTLRVYHAASPFEFQLRYKVLGGDEAVVRFGSAGAPLERGEVVPGTYCSRNFYECYRKKCRLQSPNYPGMYPRNVTCYLTLRQKTVPTCKHAMISVRQESEHKVSCNVNCIIGNLLTT
ncbi:hypothetical protein J6590_008211 [Homalodisca vitripennis]|nr:hypothetical protein J6590_008211 [Homalodisca vitripennis]